MSLSDLVGAGLEEPIAALRRHAISIAVAASAAIGSLFYLASAATQSLEMFAGPIGARLIIGATLALIATGSFLAPRFLSGRTRGPIESVQAKADAMTSEQKIALVLEALRFGFSMGSGKPESESGDGRK
jgi:hypothetical protein